MSWRTTRLGDLVDVLDHKRIPLSAAVRAQRNGPIPYYGAAGRVGWIDEALFDEELILLGEDGIQFFDATRPKAYRIEGPAWVNNHAHVLRARGDVDARFLLHFLNQFDYRGYANGTTRLKLTQASMRNIPVDLPDFRTQRRIVDILEDHLSRLDAAGHSLERVLRGVEATERSFLDRCFGADGIQVSPLDHWLVESRGGWSRSRSHIVDTGGVPYLKMNNITPRGQLTTERFVAVVATEVERTRFGIREGDVLFNSKNSAELVGKTAVAGRSVDGWVFNENIIRLRFDERLYPPFVGLWFRGPQFRDALSASVRASTHVAAVYAGALRQFPIWVPEREQQERLVREFEALRRNLDRLADASQATKVRAKSLRRALLTFAFSGKLTGAASDSDRIEELSTTT